MNLNQQELPSDTIGQSPGWDPKTSKRNSGLFSFLKWFKPSTSRESIDIDVQNSHSSSCDSLNSIHSTGTVASFSYVPPSAYTSNVSEKCIVLGPETDTYKARLKQRDKRRENDKNVTLRKKYNLFFNRETLLKSRIKPDEENTKSLPLMTRANMQEEEEKVHRRTNSESSKIKKAGAYLHVKGKRKAPQPPPGLGSRLSQESSTSTMSLRRKKRLAPPPPAEKVTNFLQQTSSKSIEYADADIICNDSLKLDHGILKPAKETDVSKSSPHQNNTNSPNTSARSSYVEAPVSPRPWYKRNTSRDNSSNAKKDSKAIENKYEPIERLPDLQYMRNSLLDLTLEDVQYEKKKDEKRKSGLAFLRNISELDREATEIIKKEHQKTGYDKAQQDIPEFMRPKDEPKINTDSWVSPKRRSARDLIAKFNAITNVTKVTVFGMSPKDNSKRDYFGKQHSLDENKRQESLLESHKKRIEQIDNKKLKDENKLNILMKSESASAIKTKTETPKLERINWKCPKCFLENEYWRIICHVCSAIKPYFDDFASNSVKQNDVKTSSDFKISSPIIDARKTQALTNTNQEKVLERSRTQIGFSALASYNANNKKKLEKSAVQIDEKQQMDNKKEEKEKLKKMLIEMKNSLPKRKSNILNKQSSRASIIVENPEHIEEKKITLPEEKHISLPSKSIETTEKLPVEKTQEQKVASILIGTTQTIYENIKVRKTENPKPIKISSAVQTSSVVKKIVPPSTITNLLQNEEAKKNHYELMRPKDFENIYSDKNGTSAARIYANLAQNDELSLFFNMPKGFADIKNNINQNIPNNTDTIEINRLLRRLESAIAKGELTEASIFAKELAQLKVNCSVIRQKSFGDINNQIPPKIGFQIEMFVEDKLSHRGPFPIQVTENQTVAMLKKQIEREFEIPVNVQRWILGKELATDETATLKDHNVTTEGCPVFLYLVAPEFKTTAEQITQNKYQPSSSKASELNILPKEELKTCDIVIKRNDVTSDIRDNKLTQPNSLIEENVEDHSPKIVKVIPKVLEISASNKSEKIKQNDLKIEPIKHATEVTIQTATTKSLKTEIVTNHRASDAQKTTVIAEVKKPLIALDLKLEEAKNKTEMTIKTVTTPLIEDMKADKKVTVETKKTEATAPGTAQVTVKEEIKLKSPPKAKEEDVEEYDAKTLRPSKSTEWECHLCTLLNSITSNICAVCATVRLKKSQVAPKKSIKKKAPQPKTGEASGSKLEQDQTYRQLVNLDNADLVENSEPFECLVCFSNIPPRQGITLRECLHQFCKVCLAHTVEYSEEAEVKCPYRDSDYSCNIALQDREIKSLVTTGVYEQYLAKSVAQAENKMDKSFHCKTPDCKGWCIFEDNVNDFRCPVCRHTNCLTCQAIHSGLNCKQYQERMNSESEIDDNAKRTKEMLDEMVDKGEALTCPTCRVILMKKWGCDWLRCSMCKTEICWVTRGPRWGPGGKGDTSGGCQCGVNGTKCHPQCNYCH